MTPFIAPFEFQRQQLEAAIGAVDRSRRSPEQFGRMADVDVGETPNEVVYTENKLQLRYYESTAPEDEQHDVPILLVYALINRPYILDLQPDRSVVRTLLEGGFDVYMIDWGEPSILDTSLTLSDYVNRYIDNCVDVVRERSGHDSINVLGYCMGGTMSAMYAALYPEKVRSLALMAAGLHFDETGGLLEMWGDESYYDPAELADTLGNVPSEFLDVGFALMDPVDNFVTKYVRLYDNVENDDFVENFARMEEWLSDGIDVAGETYREFLEDIYQDNKLARNELELDGVHVDVGNITMPVLQIVGEYDHLIPPEASKPFNDVVGSDDVTTFEFPTGHIGLSVSGKSHGELWPDVCEWFADRSAEESDPGESSDVSKSDLGASETEETAETAESTESTETAEPAADDIVPDETPPVEGDPTDLERIDGVGPSYAERLRDAGIQSLGSLARADADQVADALDLQPERVRDWVEQAKELVE